MYELLSDRVIGCHCFREVGKILSWMEAKGVYFNLEVSGAVKKVEIGDVSVEGTSEGICDLLALCLLLYYESSG